MKVLFIKKHASGLNQVTVHTKLALIYAKEVIIINVMNQTPNDEACKARIMVKNRERIGKIIPVLSSEHMGFPQADPST